MALKVTRRATDTPTREDSMHPRSRQGELARRDERGDAMRPAREGAGGGDRMREIRRRIAADAYRSPEVAEEIARRILHAPEL
jgi:hypothetical protein